MLNHVASIIDKGEIRTTLNIIMSLIDAKNLKSCICCLKAKKDE